MVKDSQVLMVASTEEAAVLTTTKVTTLTAT